MPSPDSSESSSDPEVLAARGEVLLAKAELESRLHAMGDSGRRALARVARKARPALVAAAVLVGVVVVVRLVQSASRRRRASGWRQAGAGQPSLLKVAFGAALRGAVRVVATRMAEQAVLRLAADGEQEEPDAGRAEGEDGMDGAEAERLAIASSASAK